MRPFLVLLPLLASCTPSEPSPSEADTDTDTDTDSDTDSDTDTDVDISAGLVAHYAFSGNADDSSGNEHHGIEVDVGYTTDPAGTADAALLNNGNGRIDLGTDPAFDFGDGSLTITYWFKASSGQSYMTVLMSGTAAWAPGVLTGLNWDTGRVIFGLGTADGMLSTANAVGINTVDTWLDDTWHHVAVVMDSDAERARIYVDGTAEELVKYDVFGATGGTLVDGDTALDTTGVGYSADRSEPSVLLASSQYGQGFDGSLDEIRVYDRALTAAEVSALATP